jgi:hypothetical protein
MDSICPELLSELRTMIEQLGNQGGLVSPSVYDTAQVLRLYPPKEGVIPGLKWLLSQQHEDGGWGVQAVPSARSIPTLAAILALYTYRHEYDAQGAIQAGLNFLEHQATQWMSLHIDLVPIAGEMILPYLLQEAAKMGLVIDQAPYARIFELRRIKLRYLGNQPLPSNSAPTYSWEALGFPHRSEVLHAHTGVGHSPAATAAWLHTAKQIGEDDALCAKAEAYLARAAATTGTRIPGVVPMVYPITGFELCYGLYALLLTGILDHPELQDVVAPKLASLRDILEQEKGLTFGEYFVPDVDDTAVAVAVLRAAQQPADVELVHRFWRSDHFYTYAHELNPSVFSNAHALHGLVLCGERCKLTEEFLIRRQTVHGIWLGDKWHTSWRNSTMEVIAALRTLGYKEQLVLAAQALMADQNIDGSWGEAEEATLLETSYGVIALQMLTTVPHLSAHVQPALKQGRQWLWKHTNNWNTIERTWLGKEVYSAVRVDALYRLSAMLSPMLHQSHTPVLQSVESSDLSYRTSGKRE